MAKYLQAKLDNVEFFDLQDNPLPMCDGDECYDLPEVLDFREKVKNAEGIIMAIPVYNFNVSSGAKNIVELGGRMLYDKIFGFIFGFFRAYVIVVCIFTTIDIIYNSEKWPIDLDKSFTFHLVEKGSNYLIKEFPDEKQYKEAKEKVQDI